MRLLFFLCLFALTPAAARPLRVAVDGSGSMRGYQATGALDALVADVLAAGEAAGLPGLAKVFHAGPKDARAQWADWSDWLARPRWGQTTLLDDALRTSVRGARAVVLITDNFQDPFGTGGGGAGTTEAFYRTLAGVDLHRAWLAPALVRFDGNVDLAAAAVEGRGGEAAAVLQARLEADTPADLRAGGRIGAPRWTGAFWKVPYQGRRALAVYLVLVQPEDAAAFEGFRAALVKRRPELQPLLIKPLGADALVVRPARSAAADPRAVACGGPAPWPDAVPLRLVPGAEGPELRPVDATLDPRVPGRAVAAVEVVATAAHIGVSGDLGQCDRAARVAVTGAQLRPTDPRGGLLAAAVAPAQVGVSPGHVLGPLDPAAEVERALQIQLALPPLVGADVPRDRAGAAVAGSLELAVRVPRAALSLSAEARARAFTQVPTDLARLYSPDDIVQALAEGPIEIRLPVRLSPYIWAARTPVVVTAPARWPWLLLLLPLLGVLATRPYGFAAPVRVGEARFVHTARVGGWLARARVSTLALPDGALLRVHRAGLMRRVAVVDAAGTLRGHLRPGRSLTVAGVRVRWLARRDARRAIEAGDWDPHAG